VGLDRIVMANNTGVLSQVSTSALVTANAWSLSGNPITSSGTTLGIAPTGSFLGATSNQNLQLVTNNLVRAIVTAGGVFQTNSVAIGGGAINGTTIGATTASTGRFTTLDATGNATVAGTLGVTGLTTASGGVRTPSVNGTTALALTADAGTLSLTAGGANVITATTNGAERLRIAANGNVGVGTNNPTNLLEVNGTFRATGNSAIGGTLDVTGATNLSNTLGVSGATTLGSTLGVSGATTLNSTLTVAGASRINNTLRVTGLATADVGVRTPSVTSTGTLDLGALNADPIVFSTDGVERMRVDASGRIGIGTSTPNEAQVMIQNRSPTLPGLMVRGNLLQTGRILDIQSGPGTTFFSIAASGETRVARRFVTEDETAFVAISGGSAATLMGDNDRIVVANPQGRIAQVSPAAFVDQYAWGLIGNAPLLSDGALGDAPLGSFLGTTNARDLRLVTNNTVRAILNSADGRFDVATLRANELSSAGNLILRGGATVEGLRVTTTGRVGVGSGVNPEGSTGAQLMVDTGVGTTRGLVVNGRAGQTANLFEARVNGVNRFEISPSGAVSAASMRVADIGAGDPNTLTPAGYDRVVVANNQGQLSQIAFSQLSNEATWLLAGNTGITSGGNLGQTVTGRFLGMVDAQPIRFVTDNKVGAILTAAGQFQTNNVAIGGGTINGTVIGNGTPAAGTFTALNANTLTANTSVTTPTVSSGGSLTLATTGASAGGIALSAGGSNAITFATDGNERLRLTNEGRLGLGTTSPGAQLQVNNASAGTKLLVVNGVAGQTANLLEAQVGGTSRFTVTQAGSVTAAGGVTADSMRVIGVGAGSPNNSTPSGYDRVVIANGAGNFSQIAFSQLTNENTWLIAGNIGGTSGGALGSAPTAGSRILGTRDDVDLRFATNNLVRAIITRDGVFQANQVGFTGGTIDGVTIGGTTRAAGAFTTVTASTSIAAGTSITAGTTITAGTSVITPLVTNTGNLAVTANNGALTLSTAGAVSPGSVTVAAGGDNPISLFTDNVERLRITGALGRVGIGTTSPGAQLQVNTPIDSGIGLIVSGTANATGDLMAVRAGGSDVLRVRRTDMIVNNPLTVNGAATVSSLNVTGATTLTALGGAVGGLSGDRVVVANASGQLSQVARSTLVTAEAWGLSGNANIGAGNFIGTTDDNDLRFRTNNITRATITAGGQFQTNNVAIGGGAINNTTIGSGGAAGGTFTTLNASTVNAGSSVNTPLVTRVNSDLTLSTTATAGNTAGSITLAAGSESPILFRTTDLATERMRLTTDGRLGLGTTTPDRTLDILGTFRASSDGSVGGAFSVGGRLTVAGGNSPAVNGLTVNGTSLTKIGSLGGDRNEVVLSGFDRVVLANAAGELQQYDLSQFRLITDPDDPSGGGSGSSVAVDDEGNQLTLALARLNFVGEGVIATASGNNITVSIPGVNGTLTRDPEFDTVRVEDWIRTPRINASGALTVATGGSDRLTVTATGQVGIGTASPAAQLQVVPADDDTVGLRITGAAASPAANLLEIGTTGSPTNLRVDRSGNLVTSGAVNAGGTITFGNLAGTAGASMGGNDRLVIANSSGRLAQVSPSTLIANVGWSLFGNSLTEETSGGFGEVPVGRYIGTNNAIDLRFVTNGRVRAILTADGAFQSDNAVLTGGRIDGMPIGATTRSTGAFTGVAVTNTLTAGTSVVTPLIANSGNIALTADNGAISLSTVGTSPQGITFSAGGNNTIAFRTDDRERLRIVGGELSPIVIGGAAAIENSMLQINTAQDSTAGLLVVGTAASTGDLLRVGVTNALDPTDPTPVLRARRTGVYVTSLVSGTNALAVNGSTQLTGSLTVSESATFNTLAGTANTTRGSNDRVVLANNGGVLSQVTPEGLVSEYAWALNGNPIAASAGEIGAAPTGDYLGTTSNNDLRLVTNGLVRAIVTRGGQFQSDNVALSGGAINGTSIGASTRASGAFTSLASNAVVNAPGMTGSSLGFTAGGGSISLVANSGQIGLTARGAASPILFSTRPLDDDVERLRITPEGLVGIGTGTPEAQLQVDAADDDIVGLAVNGTPSTSGSNLLTVRRGSTSLLNVGRTASSIGTSLSVSGTTSVPALNASGAVTFTALAGAAGANDTSYDRVVVANSSGRLSQIARSTFVTSSAWGLRGNTNTTVDDFLGTTDESDLRFGTNGAIRATLTSGGEFQIADVAIASGTIEGTTIGLNTPAAARFTTAVAGTSVTTPLLQNAGALALTTTAGNLSLNAGGLSRITAATNGTERLRIDEDGLVFIGDRDLNGPALIDPANDSLPQLQVNSAAAVSPALVARGYPGQVANLLEVQGYSPATSRFERELTVNAAGVVNLRSLSGPTNPVVTVGDRIVVSNAQGRLLQVDTVKLITATTWGLTGNAVITQPGTLGAAPTGNFLGTTDARDVGFVTNNLIRAMIDSGGTFRTAGNLVANGVTVGRGLDALPGNTAVGTGALADNNGGDDNSAFGANALRLNTLGQRNTALGVRAMQGNFVGLNNVAVGVDALRDNVEGSGNVALGFEAAYNEAGSNRLYIANSRNNNLVYGDFSTGRVLINAGATPPATLGAALQVNSNNAGDVGLIVRGTTGQTANLFEARNVGGGVVARISNAGNTQFSGTLGVTGATTLSSTLDVSAATGLGSTLTVAGATTLNGATQVNNTLTVTGATTISNNLSVSGNGTITGALDVTGTSRLRNTLLVDGATTIDDTLAVTGNSTIAGTLGVTSTATASKFIPTGNVTAGNGMYLPAADEVAFSTAGAERLRLDNNGNVGVGTNDPQFRLDVNGTFRATSNATVGGTLAVTGDTTLGGTLGVTSTASAAKFIPTGGTVAGNGMFLPAANTLGFSAGGTETMRVTATGVGIGMAPARTLDVTGTFRANGNSEIGGTLGVTGATTLSSTLGVSGATTLGSTLGVTGVTTLSNLGGTAATTIPVGLDRIVMANNTGVLSQVSTSALVTANA
ncbi:beta strand repeat-containing protein, partial [Flavobacterium sp.]|uniref:beta strand repeat-containing protein n=1 Tax=Flavobacterium sp. TaxID=239 RepID=UPI0037C06037